MSLLLKIRTLLFYLTATIGSIVFYGLFYIPLKYGTYKTKYKMAQLFSKMFVYLCKFIGGINYNITGLEKLPNQPSLVLANHQSFWDNLIMQLFIPIHSWVLKKQLYKIPIIGGGLKMLKPIAVDRSTSMSVKQIIKEGTIKIVNDKLWLVMFPESTRLRPEQTVTFKASAAKLALLTKAPIVLIAHNAGIFWPKGFWFKSTGTIEVVIIDVLYLKDYENLTVRELTTIIENKINSVKNQLLANRK